MYAEFFGLRELPFNNTPDPRFFFSTPDHEEALASLIYAVRERKGFVLLTGDVGAGKTLVSRVMLRNLGAGVAFATVNHAVQNATDLLESVCTEFEIPFEAGAGHAQLIRKLHDFLLAQFAHDTPVVLILDEAQTLPVDAFEQLRMIGNLEADDAKLLQIVILGQLELQNVFTSPELRQLRQRIFRVFHLPALSREATEGYIQHRLSIAGTLDLDVFDPAAIDRVYECSRGLPRLINTICDNAMLSAYSADQRRIDAPLVESVVSQMLTLGEERSDVPTGASPTLPAWQRSAASLEHPPNTEVPSRWYPATTEALTQRIMELERQFHGVPATGPYPEAPSHVPRGWGTDPTLERLRFEQGLRSMVAEVDWRCNGLERQFKDTRAMLAEARGDYENAKQLVDDARTTVTEAQIGCRQLAQQEERLRRLSTKLRAVVEETRRIFDGLKKSVTSTMRAERSAREACDCLVAQTDRSRKLAGRLEDMLGRVARQGDPAQADLTMVKDAVVSVARAGVHPDDFGRVLSETRDSLSELRSIARGLHDEGDAEAAGAHGQPAASTAKGEETSTARFVREMEGLLEMIESS